MNKLAAAAVLATGFCLQQPAQAKPEERPFCADRPGLNTPACVLDQGRLQIEGGLGDWTLERDVATRTTTWTAADILVRYGLTPTTEVRVNWTAYGQTMTRQRGGAAAERGSGTGDVQFSVRQNLHSPDGSDLSIAVMPYANVGVGGDLGSRGWSGGVVLPLSYDLGRGLSLQATPQVDFVHDEEGSGRHVAYGAAAGLGIALGDAIGLNLEAQFVRNRHAGLRSDLALASVSIGYELAPDWQVDVGAAIGLNATSPDVAIGLGLAHRL